MMKRKLFTLLFALALVAAVLTAVAAADTATVATVGDTPYTDLQKAIDASNGQLVKLETTGGDITVNGDVSIDLNGFSINSVNVQSGTLYGMDSSTDNYDNPDNCGKIGTVSGSVAGLAAESTLAQDGYLMICEGTEAQTQVSFHRVNLRIHTMTLRGSDAGVYYSCDFEGDKLVADNVKQFGVALSIDEIPDEDNLDTDCGYSYFTGFQAGAGANAGESTSTLLYNVMDETLPDLANTHRANLPVNGRAYILTDDDRYVFGTTASYSFKWATQQADAGLSGYSKDQVAGAVGMYKKFSKVMAKWDVDNIESALCLNTKDPLWTPEEGKDIKVLAITSSFGLNTTQLLYDVILDEAEAQEITLGEVTVARLYTSGCTLEKHITYAPDKPVYQYTKITNDADDPHVLDGTLTTGKMTQLYPESTENGATLLTGLLDEEWDIIFMQQGARQAALLDTYTDANGNDYITQLRDIMKPYVDKQCPDARFVWNMLWAFENGSGEYPFNTTFNSNQMAMYQANVDAVTEYVIPRTDPKTDYDRIIPTGTVLQNARTSAFGDTLCKDSYHLDNRGGVVAAYGLYAVITGQELTEINLDVVSSTATNGIAGTDFSFREQLSEKHKLIIMESINNALKKPFEVTTSEYPPVDYSGYNYTDDLEFFGESKIAVCPACRDEVTWIEVNETTDLDSNKYLCTASTMAQGTYHFYLSTNITYEGANFFLQMGGSERNVCLHLNGNNLTTTANGIAVLAGNAKLNIMGTGTVTGNHEHTNAFRGSAIILNAGTTTNPGTVRLYSGTYVQPEGNTQLAPVSTAQQGGLLEIYKDATITGNADNYSLCVYSTNGTYTETVNIYGGTFNRPVYCYSSSATTTETALNISGGTFNDGIKLVNSNTNVKLSGSPKILGSGLKLAAGVTVTLGELTEGTSIAVDATGAFTAANSNAQTYLDAGYFTAVQAGYGIDAIENILHCKETA